MADSAFVGRDSELATLWKSFGRARAGSGGVVVIAGEPGMGKTRLAREFARGAENAGAAIAWGRCYEGEWTPPLAPWGEAVGDIVTERVSSADQSLLANILPRRGSARVAPHSIHLTGGDERLRVFDAATRVLLNEAVRRPLVVVVDDIQWADQVSMDLLRHFAFYVPHRAVLLLVTDRSGELARSTHVDDGLSWVRMEIGATMIGLEGLPLAAIATMAEANGLTAPGIAAALASRTAGNPFFLGELISHGVNEGAAELSSDIDPVVPENVRFVVSRRLQRLSDPAQLLLNRAAVFANGFDLPVLQRMIAAPDDKLLDALDEALAARFLQAVPGRPERYDFVHAIVRQCLSHSWNPSRRVRLHRQAAEAIEAVYSGQIAQASAEIAVQYHRSRSLPGAIAGLPHAIRVVAECHEQCTPEHAVTFLRIARDLSREGPVDGQASVTGQLASAEAEIVQVESALATMEEYLALARQAGLPPQEVADRLDILARSLKYSAYAGEQCWRPIVERALKLVGPQDGRVWARLRLMLDPVEPLSRSGIRVGRWLGFDPVSVEILRSTGDDHDAARSMESFDAVSRAETDEYLTRCRGWSNPAAVMYGLTVAANHYQYRHGALRDARLLWQELIELSSRANALHWQQQATNQLTYLLIAEGAFAEAAETELASNELSVRLGPGQHAAAHELEMATCRAIYQGGDWPDIARRWREMLDDPTFGPHDLATLTGALYGGLAAYCSAWAGDKRSTLDLLELLTPIVEQMSPVDSNHNGAIAFAAGAVWRVRAAELAPVYRRLILAAIEDGIGDYPQSSLHLALGQMAALMNRRPEAVAAFADARRSVAANGQAPLTPVIDLVEAEALLIWCDAAEYQRFLRLIAAARHRFLEFEMTLWLEDLERLAAEADGSLGGRQTLPAGITDREADVLRLIARGMSDRQVGGELFVSPRTVNAHVRNLLSKTGAANRVELAMWARTEGIVTA